MDLKKANFSRCYVKSDPGSLRQKKGFLISDASFLPWNPRPTFSTESTQSSHLPEAAIANFKVDPCDICLLLHDREVMSERPNRTGGRYPRMPTSTVAIQPGSAMRPSTHHPRTGSMLTEKGRTGKEIEVVIDIWGSLNEVKFTSPSTS